MVKRKVKQEIEFLMRYELSADSYKKGEDWQGYKVYEPVYKNAPKIGYPLVVLVKDDEVMVSTEDEAFDYLEYTLRNEPDEE